MKKTHQSNIQAKIFDFALSELVRNQRETFEPIWTVDSWVKFLIWLSLNCGFSGEQESLENFVNALGSALTVRMRKIFFERVVDIDSCSFHVMADPADSQVLLMPIGTTSVSNEKVQKILDILRLTPKVRNEFSKWEYHDQLMAIPWNSTEKGC